VIRYSERRVSHFTGWRTDFNQTILSV
jgi:hypothetical protein